MLTTIDAYFLNLAASSRYSVVTSDACRQKVLQVRVKKRRIVLEKIVEVFEPGRAYSERQVNLELLEFHAAALHRALVAQRLVGRGGGAPPATRKN